MKKVTEFNFSNLETIEYPSNYDENKLNFSKNFKQYTTGNPTEKGVGTKKIGLARPLETGSVGISTSFPYVIDIDENLQYVFSVEIAAGVNRRILKHTFNKNTSEYNWDGYIQVTMPVTGNITPRGLEVIYDVYNSGTVEVNGTSVSGSGTNWVSDNLCVGSRIGFGSDSISGITSWFTITSIDSEGLITIDNTAGTIPSGTTYVIEDLRVVMAVTNATATNGGLFLIKGLSFSDFSSGGSIIPAATTVDKIKAVYWIKDASTVTNTASWGNATDEKTSWTEQLTYIVNGAVATSSVYVYNIRASLTSLSSGGSTDGFVFKTGNAALTGTLTQLNGVSIGTLNHGVSSGIKSLFYVTSNRVYRSSITDIVNGTTNWSTDVMLENPVGGTNSMPATNSLRRAFVINPLDSLLIETSNASSAGSYITKYDTSGVQFDNVFFGSIPYYQGNLTDVRVPIFPTTINTAMSMAYSNDYVHTIRYSTSNLTHQIYSLPIISDWFYSNSDNCVITPKITTNDAIKFYNLYINNGRRLGDVPFTIPYEPIRVYYRTVGINDDSGSWNLLDDTFDLSFLSPVTEIQFKIVFKVLGVIGIPPILHSLCLTYEDDKTDSHYEPSIAKSSIGNRIFAWRQSNLWLTNIPDLKIKIQNIDTNTLILEDSTNTQSSGVWEYSDNDGVNWNSWSSTANTIGNYIRYTANSLPSSVKTKVTITQL
jgi:hypothetical protein